MENINILELEHFPINIMNIKNDECEKNNSWYVLQNYTVIQIIA